MSFLYAGIIGFIQSEPIFALAIFSVIVAIVLALLIAMVISVSKKNRLLYRKTIFDDLTHIYNYEYFIRKVKERIKNTPHEKSMMLVFDISKFKLINEYFGTKTGDDLLCYISDNLRSLDKFPSVIYGRIGNDKFCLYMPYSEETLKSITDECYRLADKYNKIQFKIVPYMGIYVTESSEISPESMVDRAIIAIKTIKGQYNQKFVFFDNTMLESITVEQEIVGEMEKALKNKEFLVFYQPKYELQSNTITGSEALVRWKHPKKGMISPGVFIPVFENNGFIMHLDYYVWESVCRYLRSVAESGGQLRPISVNVSRVNLFDSHLVTKIVNLVKKYKVDPKYIELELTESAYTGDNETLKEVISKLHDNGFRVLMDDFGSGYSSLNMLKDYPIDTLKIDMKFLASTDKNSVSRARNIISSVVRMAKWLNIPVIAEGTETKEQIEFLRSVGCEMAQGYYFAKPMSEEDYTALSRKNKYVGIDNSEDFSIDDAMKVSELWEMSGIMSDMFNNTMNALAIVEMYDDKVDIIKSNDNYLDLIRITRTKFYDSKNKDINVLDSVHKDDRDKIKKLFKKAASGKKPEKSEYRRFAYDGTLIWLEISILFIAEKDGRGMYYVAINDVTRIKKAEQKFIDEKRKYEILIEEMNKSKKQNRKAEN